MLRPQGGPNCSIKRLSWSIKETIDLERFLVETQNNSKLFLDVYIEWLSKQLCPGTGETIQGCSKSSIRSRGWWFFFYLFLFFEIIVGDRTLNLEFIKRQTCTKGRQVFLGGKTRFSFYRKWYKPFIMRDDQKTGFKFFKFTRHSNHS